MRAIMQKNRPGMTIVEMLIALTIFSVVVAGALGAFEKESDVLRKGTDRLGVLQNFRFAVDQIQQDIRLAGSGVTAQQPALIYAGANVVAFNADYASNTQNDISAVFADTSATNAEVGALPETRRITIPATSFSYPDTTYMEGGVNGAAETIVFFFQADTATTRTDDYRLYRQVNDQNPELVARNLLQTDSTPFFQYYEQITSDTAATYNAVVPSNVLPLTHSAAVHMSAADTGSVARIDGVRGVRINLTATNGLTGTGEHTIAVSRLIWLPNVGLATSQSCGGKPLAVTTVSATGQLNATSGNPEVALAWGQSIDENGGEHDVVRYVVWRRLAGITDWGSPYLSIPAGASSYSYVDGVVQAGQTYQYAVSAQDCTPTLSDQSTTVTAVVPTP